MKVIPRQRISLKDRVFQFIRDAILSGKLGPGDRIVKLKLAKDLGIGTTAVENDAQRFQPPIHHGSAEGAPDGWVAAVRGGALSKFLTLRPETEHII